MAEAEAGAAVSDGVLACLVPRTGIGELVAASPAYNKGLARAG